MEKLKLSDDGRYFHHHFEEIQPFAFAPDGSIIYPESDRKLLVEFIVAHANEVCKGFPPSEAVRHARDLSLPRL